MFCCLKVGNWARCVITLNDTHRQAGNSVPCPLMGGAPFGLVRQLKAALPLSRLPCSARLWLGPSIDGYVDSRQESSFRDSFFNTRTQAQLENQTLTKKKIK